MADKMRVHILAKELNVSSKAIIDKCLAEGIDSVKNHMSTLSAGLHATIKEWFSEGRHSTALETAQPIDLKKVRIKSRKKAASTGDSPLDKTFESEAVATGTATMDAPPVFSVAAEPELETKAPEDDETFEGLGAPEAPPPPEPILEAPPIIEVAAELPVATATVAETHAPLTTIAQARKMSLPRPGSRGPVW